MPLDQLLCCEHCISCFSGFMYFEVCLYFVLTISKWKLPVQLSFISLTFYAQCNILHWNQFFRIAIVAGGTEIVFFPAIYITHRTVFKLAQTRVFKITKQVTWMALWGTKICIILTVLIVSVTNSDCPNFDCPKSIMLVSLLLGMSFLRHHYEKII